MYPPRLCSSLIIRQRPEILGDTLPMFSKATVTQAVQQQLPSMEFVDVAANLIGSELGNTDQEPSASRTKFNTLFFRIKATFSSVFGNANDTVFCFSSKNQLSKPSISGRVTADASV